MQELSCSDGRQTMDGRQQTADGRRQTVDGRRRMADDIIAAACRPLSLPMFSTAVARRHCPTAVIVAAVSLYVFLCRRCAVVRLPIPMALVTTTTMTRTTTGTTSDEDRDNRSHHGSIPPVAEAAQSIVGLPRGAGWQGVTMMGG